MINCETKKDHLYQLNNGNFILESYYPSGKIKELTNLNADTIMDGLHFEFYLSGDTSKVTRYKSGKKDSIETEIYESGNLKSLRYYKNGIPWGEYIEYFDGLKDKYFIVKNNDTLIIQEPRKKIYSVYNFNSNIGYSLEYDKNGDVINSSGHSILFTKLEKYDFNVGDTLDVQFYLASPDGFQRNFYLNILSINNKMLETDTLSINKKYNAAFFNKILREPGTFNIQGISIFTYENSGMKNYDTTNFKIVVSKKYSTS